MKNSKNIFTGIISKNLHPIIERLGGIGAIRRDYHNGTFLLVVVTHKTYLSMSSIQDVIFLKSLPKHKKRALINLINKSC